MQVNASLNNNFRAKQIRQLQESHLSAALRVLALLSISLARASPH